MGNRYVTPPSYVHLDNEINF